MSSPEEPAPDHRLKELVRQALSPALSLSERGNAFRELEPSIKDMARRCGAKIYLRQQMLLDLVEESPGFVAQILHKYRPEKGRFLGWLHKVLLNYGRDLRRKKNRVREIGMDKTAVEKRASEDPGGGHPDLESEASPEPILGPLRQALDEIVWDARGELDYFAILLVQIRLKLAENYLRECSPIIKPGEVSKEVESWFPWREKDLVRRFRPTYPDLESLWQAMIPYLDRGMGLRELADLINARKSAGPDLTPGTLTQWMSRSRVEARSKLGQTIWEKVGLARLLDRPKAEAIP